MRERSPNEVINWLVVVLAFSIPLYRAWVSLAAILILLIWFFKGDFKAQVERLRRHRLTVAVVIFMAFNLLSILWSEDPGGGFEYWRKYLYLLLIPAIATTVKPVFARRAFCAYVIGTVISVALMPIIILGDIHIRHIHPGNPAATMSHLDYSMILAVAGLLILVHLTQTTMSRRHRLLWLGLFGIVLAGLMLNIGRSGQFAFAASLAFLVPFLLRRRSWIVRATVLTAVAGALIATYLLVPPLHQRVETAAVELHDAVVDHRIDTNQGKRLAGMMVGLEIVRSHPVIGTGLGGNMIEFRRLLDTKYPQFKQAIGWFPHLHNQYIQVATEVGLVGLLMLLMIFAALFLGRYSTPEIQAAAVAVGCAYLFGFFGDPFLHKQLPLVLFALSAGIISADDEALVHTSSQSTVDS